MPIDSHCNRCLKPAPGIDDDQSIYWEGLGDGSLIVCPDCMTPGELQSIDETDMDLFDGE